MRTFACWLCLLAACSGNAPMVIEPVDRVVRPTSVTGSHFPTESYSTSPSWSSLTVAESSQTALLSTGTGLFEAAAPGRLEQRSTQSVLGLLPLTDGAVLVAQPDGLYEWRDSQLRRSQLHPDVWPLDRLLGSRADELWFGRGASLLRFASGRLESFTLPKEVGRLHLAASQTLATASAVDGSSHWMLTRIGTEWSQQPLGEELVGLTAVVPWGDSDLLALAEGGKLWRRMKVPGGLAWRRVSLSMDPKDPGAEGLTFLVVEPAHGTVACGDGNRVYRLQGSDVFVQSVDAPLREVQWGRAGLLWGLTASGPVRIGRAEPVTYERIAPIAQVHCVRCHVSGRQGTFSLETAAEWRARIDSIITRTTAVAPTRPSMPADNLSTPSPTELDLIRQWKEDGLL